VWDKIVVDPLLGKTLLEQHRQDSIEMGAVKASALLSYKTNSPAAHQIANTSESVDTPPQREMSPPPARHGQSSPTPQESKTPKLSSTVSKKILQTEKREAEKLMKRFGEKSAVLSESASGTNIPVLKVKVRMAASPADAVSSRKLEILKSLLAL